MSSCTVLPAGLAKVPPFPALAARLLALLANPVPDIAKVAELISGDPALTAHVLKSVNSYEYALQSHVTSIRHAVGLLGSDRIRTITTTTATATYIKRLMTADMLRSWHHSIATAVLAEEIARSCRAFWNIAFAAGIMHDLGRLGLLVAHPQEYQQLIRDAEENDLDLLELEEQKLGINHAEAGRLLAGSWGLPEEFRLINGRHHDSCDGTEIDLLWIVHVACRVADTLGFAVVTPRAGLAVAGVAMPPGTRWEKSPEELCALIEERISAVT